MAARSSSQSGSWMITSGEAAGQPLAANMLQKLPVLQSDFFPDVGELVESLVRLTKQVSWRRILSAHVHKSKKIGGPVCVSVNEHLTVEDCLGDREGLSLKKAVLILPHSFDSGDNAACGAEATADGEKLAIEQVCKKVLIELFVRDVDNTPSRLVLHANHWQTSVEDLLAGVFGIVSWQPAAEPGAERVPLPLPQTRAQSGQGLYEPPIDEAAREQEVLAFLRRLCDNAPRGEAAPSRLSKIQMPTGKLESAWKELAKLLKPGGLQPFLKAHADEFAFDVRKGKLYSFRRQSSPHQPAPTARLAAPPAAHALGGACTCGRCEATWIARGWKCPS